MTAIAGTQTNTATADSDQTTPITDGADYFGAGPGLNLIKEVSSDNATWVNSVNVSVGDTVYYRIRVQNTGNILLTGLTVDDGMAGCTLVRGLDASGNNDNDFEPGETWVYTCSVTAVAGAQTNTATADSDQTTPVTDGADYFGNAPMIGVAKRVVVAPVEVTAGTWDVTYEILVRNYGNVALSNVQVTDNLSATFPPETTFTVQSLTSTDFAANWPGYNGSSNINLLAGTDTLNVGNLGALTLVVRIVPVASGPFQNTAIASGQSPSGDPVYDDSQDGINPDPDSDGDPTNNDDGTPVVFGPNVFDPPSSQKTYDASGIPQIEFRMVWINDSNIVAINVQVIDQIPAGTTYVPGSIVCTPRGASSTALTATLPLSSTADPSSACGFDAANNRVQWQGIIAPDFGVTDETNANNEVVITFRVTVNDGVNLVYNQAIARADADGDDDFTDENVLSIELSNQTIWERSAATVTEPIETPSSLPATGFAPNRTTYLPAQPLERAYSSTDVMLVIPSLGLTMPIVGVPLVDGDWDVSWLSTQAGWLEGTAFPSWKGNSVLTSHAYLSSGLAGPFSNLGRLSWGDQIIVYAYGQKYTYQVRSLRYVKPDDTSVLGRKDSAWLTLLTCRGYNEQSQSYLWRIAVQAVLVKTNSDRQGSFR